MKQMIMFTGFSIDSYVVAFQELQISSVIILNNSLEPAIGWCLDQNVFTKFGDNPSEVYFWAMCHDCP